MAGPTTTANVIPPLTMMDRLPIGSSRAEMPLGQLSGVTSRYKLSVCKLTFPTKRLRQGGIGLNFETVHRVLVSTWVDESWGRFGAVAFLKPMQRQPEALENAQSWTSSQGLKLPMLVGAAGFARLERSEGEARPVCIGPMEI